MQQQDKETLELLNLLAAQRQDPSTTPRPVFAMPITTDLTRSSSQKSTKKIKTETPLSAPLHKPLLPAWATSDTPISKLSMPSATKTPTTAKPSNEVDVTKLDVDSMMDVTSYIGMDLKEEETFDLGDQTHREWERKEFLNMQVLESRISSAAATASITNLDPDFTELISVATKTFVKQLMQEFVRVAQLRADADVQETELGELDIVPVDDIHEFLDDYEMEERRKEEELLNLIGGKRAEQEEPDMMQSDQSQSVGGEKDKKKKQKKGEMPEAVKNKLINTTALMAAGGSLKSWMLPSGVGSMPASRRHISQATPAPFKSKGKSSTSAARQKQVKRVMVKDALLALENEPELARSQLMYKWLSNIK